jgi:hypothetical protein
MEIARSKFFDKNTRLALESTEAPLVEPWIRGEGDYGVARIHC